MLIRNNQHTHTRAPKQIRTDTSASKLAHTLRAHTRTHTDTQSHTHTQTQPSKAHTALVRCGGGGGGALLEYGIWKRRGVLADYVEANERTHSQHANIH